MGGIKTNSRAKGGTSGVGIESGLLYRRSGDRPRCGVIRAADRVRTRRRVRPRLALCAPAVRGRPRGGTGRGFPVAGRVAAHVAATAPFGGISSRCPTSFKWVAATPSSREVAVVSIAWRIIAASSSKRRTAGRRQACRGRGRRRPGYENAFRAQGSNRAPRRVRRALVGGYAAMCAMGPGLPRLCTPPSRPCAPHSDLKPRAGSMTGANLPTLRRSGEHASPLGRGGYDKSKTFDSVQMFPQRVISGHLRSAIWP